MFIYITRGRVIISRLKSQYTHEMEKNLYQFHGIGYSVYLESPEVRLEVEKNRQRNYEQSKDLVASFNKKHL